MKSSRRRRSPDPKEQAADKPGPEDVHEQRELDQPREGVVHTPASESEGEREAPASGPT